MASALKYLHGLEPKIIFRDLSTANVLLTATKAGQADAKLIDFGLAKEATRQQTSLQAEGNACTRDGPPFKSVAVTSRPGCGLAQLWAPLVAFCLGKPTESTLAVPKSWLCSLHIWVQGVMLGCSQVLATSWTP